jgi:hypothetical protein
LRVGVVREKWVVDGRGGVVGISNDVGWMGCGHAGGGEPMGDGVEVGDGLEGRRLIEKWEKKSYAMGKGFPPPTSFSEAFAEL